MITRWMCALLGHRWTINGLTGRYQWCERCALRRNKEGFRMGKWQLIETAPKDGTTILVAYTDKDPVWLHVLQWNHRCGYWAGPEEYDPMWHQGPTHWMPLPEPPLDTRV